MKIIIATDNYYPNVNGASYFTQRHAYQLKKAGHEVLVIAPSRKYSNEIFEHEGVTIFGIRSMPIERIRAPIPLITKHLVRRAIQNFKPDIIHIQSHFSIARKAARIGKELNIPVIGTNHFMPENLIHYLPIGNNLQNIAKKLAWKYFARVFNTLDGVTSPTHTAANLIKTAGIELSVNVISNGIDLNRFNASNDATYLKQRYAIPDVPVMLFVGRLDKEKNLDLILNALAKAVNQIAIHFVIAGTGAEREKLESQVAKLGLTKHVTFTGFVPDEDLPFLYATASCFIIAGTAELQSIVTMEAMATGLPIIGVNAMALPELIHDGENGLLFENGNSQQISEAILKIFQDKELREKMGKESLGIIKSHNINTITSKFISHYNEIIKNKR